MTLRESLCFHHFGLAVRNPTRAIEFLRTVGYSCSDPVHDPLQGVDLRWCTRSDSPPVELVSSEQEEGTLASILAAQGTSFYHLCYEIGGSTSSALEDIRSNGTRVVTVRDPLPAVLFGGRLVSFHLIHGFGLVELLERAISADPGRALE